jgi:hypothetical protein
MWRRRVVVVVVVVVAWSRCVSERVDRTLAIFAVA